MVTKKVKVLGVSPVNEGSDQSGGNHNARTSPVTFDAVGRKPPVKADTKTEKK
jgi:hypothetical protein